MYVNIGDHCMCGVCVAFGLFLFLCVSFYVFHYTTDAHQFVCVVWCVEIVVFGVVVGDTWCGVVLRVYGHVGQQVCEVGNQRILPLH